MPENTVPPSIILIDPQLGVNIGMAARAMLNCGVSDLRLVRPRDGWPNEDALSAAAHAARVIEQARVFASTEDAIADLRLVFATTARSRTMSKRVVTPRVVARESLANTASGIATGVLFGPEASGLTNDDIALADAIMTIPVNPECPSLNLAQAVFTVGYEWFQLQNDTPDEVVTIPKETRPARKQELVGLFEHLETELDACGFLRVEERRSIMVRNIRNVFQRARMSEQEVRTFRGIIKNLVRGQLE